MPIFIDLTDEQMKLIKPEMDKVKDAVSCGEPGILLAQIRYEGVMQVGFIDHENGKKIQAVLGGKVGAMIYT